MKKVLLIKTPTVNFHTVTESLTTRVATEVSIPIGICYLASILRENGYMVQIFDPHLERYDEYMECGDPEVFKKSIREDIDFTAFDIVGIAAQFIYTYQWGHYAAQVVKKAVPDMPIMMGGGYPSLIQGDVLNDSNIDFVIIGEGEITTIDLLEYLKTGDQEKLKKINGICYRHENEIMIVPRSSFIDDLNEIPFPAYDLVDIEKYVQLFGRTTYYGRKSMQLVTSRGCPYLCTFCSNYQSWGRKIRMRSVENILAEVDWLIDTYGIEDIHFVDDNMTVNKERFMALAAGLKERSVTWGVVNTSSFTTDEEMLCAMRDSGCINICISVESGVKETLKALKKPVDLEWTKELVRLARKYELQCTVNFISGLPYDNKQNMIETYQYAEELGCDWCILNILMPYPGTEIFNHCLDDGYISPDNLDLSKFTQRNTQVRGSDWGAEWVSEQNNDANIRINFLRNYNFHHDDGHVGYPKRIIEYVVGNHPKHLIAHICLAYALHLEGNEDGAQKALETAKQLLEDPEVMDSYGKYLEWDETIIHWFLKESGA